MLFGIDYETWWFLVVGALFSGYAILDGFDFGAGAWHLLFESEKDRRIALNAVGPVWDGNEVWLVIAGGALFAGFPNFYATLFSSLYIPFKLFLVFIIFRAIAIEFRSKEPGERWRKNWDRAYCISSIFLAFLLGVVLGNLLQGISVGENYLYMGNGFFEFLGFYPVLVGLTTLALFMMHGAIFLLIKTRGSLHEKLTKLLRVGMISFIILFSMVTIFSLIYYPHLSDKFRAYPILFFIPALAILSMANIPRLASKRNYLGAFLFSSLTISFLLVLVAVELYPDLLVSTLGPQYSINIYQAAASKGSLKIMLTITAIGAPLVAFYTFFVYKTFWGKVRLDENSY
ncbi:MAG: cytochrome d ubiquinol oxidase subunit II [Halobacteriovoraceae bacterium]|nr:cytochrome d ubiquinol oxidase subunit II [Halobacteriovoraceae bacterium]|tara:strand:+ start:9826 stop:10857 length:1032 start_codon:yes stop_codon:yes gene_type:complete